MDYYKILDLDWKPAGQKMQEYVLANPNLYKMSRGAWVNCDLKDINEKVPSLQELFNEVGLTMKRVSLFVMMYSAGVIHIDDDVEHPYRINFPVLNCENTETRFFKVTGRAIKQFQPNKFAYHMFNPAECEQVDSFELTQLTIIKTQEPHQVITNHNNFPRVSCTVAFYEDLKPLFDRL